jgi:hypothetical protein
MWQKSNWKVSFHRFRKSGQEWPLPILQRKNFWNLGLKKV